MKITAQHEVKTQQEKEVIEFVAKRLAYAFGHLNRYERSADGSYRWLYTGTQILLRLSLKEDAFWSTTLPHDISGREVELNINGKLLGSACYWKPQVYGSSFVVIDLDEKWFDNIDIPLSLARMAGFDTKGFDRSLLKIERYVWQEGDILF